jgi:hypothetical protein
VNPVDPDLSKGVQERDALVWLERLVVASRAGADRLANRVEVDAGFSRQALVRRLGVVSAPEPQGRPL